MRDILWLAKNGLKVTFRKKSNILLYILAPMMGILISLLVHTSSEQNTLRVGIVNEDKDYIATDTVNYMKKSGNFNVINIDKEDINDKVTSGKLDCVLIIGSGFSSSIISGEPADIEITSIKGAQATAYIKSYLYNYINNITAISKISNGDKEVFNEIYTNYRNNELKLEISTVKDKSASRDMTGETIGFLVMIVLMSAGNLSEIILKERQNRTYFRIASSPINTKKYIMGNVMLNFIIVTIEITLTLLVLTGILKVDMGVSFFSMLAMLLLFGLAAVGLSLLTIAFSDSSSSVGAIQNLIVVPTCLLSGCFFPIEIMPKYVQKISDFLPQKWLLEGIKSLQEGYGLSSIYMNILIIIAFAAAFFLIAIYKFYSKDDIRNMQ